MNQPSIYWFRDDQRLNDLPGLSAAAKEGPVIPVYILDDISPGNWTLGRASRWWLHQSLNSLGEQLESRGLQLVLKKGLTLKVLQELATNLNVRTIYCSRQYQPWARQLEDTLHNELTKHHIRLECFSGTLLHEPEQISTNNGTPFKVFSPFWRSCLRRPNPPQPINEPKLEPTNQHVESDSIEDWELCPLDPNWAADWNTLWSPGEVGANSALDTFLAEPVNHYVDGRDIPGESNTARISPYLRFGNLSSRQVWNAAYSIKANQPNMEKSIDKFLSEIGWREFCYHLLFHFPHIPEEAFNTKFARFPWQSNDSHLAAWKLGNTGYPIIDAGMRELWKTGFMHNRVRMIAASFLTKHLLLDWREGQAWFWDCLLDADLASNACGWQWVGGSGADAAPYFRIFNPITQGERFDKAGDYTRKWVPEIRDLPDKFLHRPWEAPKKILIKAGIKLNEEYPEPIVNHRDARETALSAYAKIKTL